MKISKGTHFGMIALHGVAGFFILSFFLSLFVYIYLQQLVHQQFNLNAYGWIRMFLLPLFGLFLGSICSYTIISIKRLALHHTLLAAFSTLILYYGDYYFGSFLHRKYTSILYMIIDKPSMNMVLLGYIVLTFLLGIYCFYFSYQLKVQGDTINQASRGDILDDQF